MAGHVNAEIVPFSPRGATVNLTVGTSSGNVALTAPDVTPNQEIPATLRLVNVGTNVIFVALGASGVTAAAATALPLLPNSERVLLLPDGDGYVAAIAASTGNTLYATTGHGGA